ncbi:MAG: hypothetical protein K2O03_14655 [Lachnospiraceae bacterium]|nr:hypothetical protein [Lachnospiraceae bacterium]
MAAAFYVFVSWIRKCIISDAEEGFAAIMELKGEYGTHTGNPDVKGNIEICGADRNFDIFMWQMPPVHKPMASAVYIGGLQVKFITKAKRME